MKFCEVIKYSALSSSINLSATSPHLRRRIWQETISTLFLTSPECKIPVNQRMAFAISKDYQYPPYLLDFKGTPAERHVENLKVLRMSPLTTSTLLNPPQILREIGLPGYKDGLAITAEQDRREFLTVQSRVQKQFIGPDCYWKCLKKEMPQVTSYFGTAWWVPFPPTLVRFIAIACSCTLQTIFPRC